MMDLYKQIVDTEKEVSNQISELKNAIYNHLRENSKSFNGVEIVSNRQVCNPVITINYERYSFLFSNHKMVFMPKDLKEVGYTKLYSVMKEIEHIIYNIIHNGDKDETPSACSIKGFPIPIGYKCNEPKPSTEFKGWDLTFYDSKGQGKSVEVRIFEHETDLITAIEKEFKCSFLPF